MWEAKIEQRLRDLPVRVAVELPDGKRAGSSNPQVTLRLKNARQIGWLATGQVGAIGEAVVEGNADLEGTMRDVMAAVVGLLPDAPIQQRSSFWSQGWQRAVSAFRHTREKDASQIQFHYDIGDDFYGLWLDPRRVYSCAYFDRPDATLAQAQEAKLDLICRKLMLKPGERFLDVGAGWGGLLLWAAEHYDVQAQGITLSHNQHAYVNRLIEEKGLQERVRMDLMDYRDLPLDQPFDKISSVGMFEHVGVVNMPHYFDHLRKLLVPGGLLLNHGITAGGTKNSQVSGGLGDFIARFIFPGGELMHVSMAAQIASESGLELLDAESLRPHYAKTLWAWSDALEGQLDTALQMLRAQGHDDARAGMILRAWRLYLAGCAVAFEQRWVSIYQLLLSHPDGKIETGTLPGAQSCYPFTRDYIYRSTAK
ncbi:cyclopropane-fatty-acyl-phospholipid synthase [Lampropedia cohaerens]|uniref:Cyclopropane-fatty-acyl-phospholipid synthase n=1 Tax=Lampropedia cohaerens TaxID=1610491 RepID=A0A0U1Q097_9BURK|nr:class I SAM-dependent methyltransferase [Lampropedia cohaerens]KKW68177.1 cyclopropane-fatty-acyl-phospholipid synthase [Lampropedia cohaerens]